MWEMERDGLNEGVKEKRSQLDPQHLAHQSFCQQGKCCIQMCWFVLWSWGSQWDLGGSADGICAEWEAINDACCMEFVKVNIVCVKSEQTGNFAFVFNLIGRLRLGVET